MVEPFPGGFAFTSRQQDLSGNLLSGQSLQFVSFMNNIHSSVYTALSLDSIGPCAHLDKARSSIEEYENYKPDFKKVSLICGF